jgi:hypothetical protein
LSERGRGPVSEGTVGEVLGSEAAPSEVLGSEAGSASPFEGGLVVLGDSEAGICVDGVCAVPNVGS